MRDENATQVLKKHGRSFYFARLFLAADTGDAAARLYRFCRLIDDIADESPDKSQARIELERIQHSIEEDTSDNPVISDFLSLCHEYSIDRQHGNTLIMGVKQDLNPVSLGSYSELINYAFKVAGVVGLMMAPVLGSSRAGYPFAIDLGIAMQFTNIARDILEDAKMQRRYLPADWVGDLSPDELQSPTAIQYQKTNDAVRQLLDLAETYYNSGISGLYYVNPKDKRAITIAAYIYREIGRELLKRDCDYRKGRVVIGTVRKCVLAATALWAVGSGKIANIPVTHEPSLQPELAIGDNHEHNDSEKA
ncbi:phytoene/squalene synthase family protein [Aliiglaciecola sp.]|nr:phytoene/squalene synthase family protein [Aliiglaciecola sp.]